MFIDRMIDATSRIQQMCKEQRLKDFQRNAKILTELKYGKRKKKVSGKFYGINVPCMFVISRFSPSEGVKSLI